MYLWKCWRDTRSSFLTLLGAVLAVGAFGGYVALDPFGWIAAEPLESRRVMWQFGTDALLGVTLGVVPLAGLWLGVFGVGVEFEKGTADFLLTRPRSRPYLLWTSWGLGAAEMLVLVLVSDLFRFASPGLQRVESLGDFLRALAALGTLALVYYSVAYLMTTLARDSRNGAALALAVIIAYATLCLTLQFWYDIEIPFFEILVVRAFRTAAGFSLATVAGWLAVCLALMLVAQFSFERAEI